MPDTLELSFISCRTDEKPAALLCLMEHVIPPDGQVVIFVASKHHVEYVHMVRFSLCLAFSSKMVVNERLWFVKEILSQVLIQEFMFINVVHIQLGLYYRSANIALGK